MHAIIIAPSIIWWILWTSSLKQRKLPLLQVLLFNLHFPWFIPLMRFGFTAKILSSYQEFVFSLCLLFLLRSQLSEVFLFLFLNLFSHIYTWLTWWGLLRFLLSLFMKLTLKLLVYWLSWLHWSCWMLKCKVMSWHLLSSCIYSSWPRWYSFISETS